VRRTGVDTVQAVDDVKSVFKGLQRLDRLRQFGFGQRATVFHTRRDAGLRIKALILHEKDHPLWPTVGGSGSRVADSRKHGRCQSRTCGGGHLTEEFSTIDHLPV
jgi:hypothetical protein